VLETDEPFAKLALPFSAHWLVVTFFIFGRVGEATMELPNGHSKGFWSKMQQLLDAQREDLLEQVSGILNDRLTQQDERISTAIWQGVGFSADGNYASEIAASPRGSVMEVASGERPDPNVGFSEPSASDEFHKRRSYPSLLGSTSASLSTNKSNSNRSEILTLDEEDMLRKRQAEALTTDDPSSPLGRLEHQQPSYHKCFHDFVHGFLFECICAMFIVLNACLMGVEIELCAQQRTRNPPKLVTNIQHGFTALFTVELSVRILADGLRFFANKYWLWNYFDIIVCASSLGELMMDSNTGGVRIVRLLRISRLLRILRITRVMRFIRALRTLVYSIFCTLKSLSWAMVLLFLIIYVFGILFTQAVNDHLVETLDEYGMLRDVADDHWVLPMYWGSLPRAMFTLFQSISGGLNWDIVARSLSEIHTMWTVLFACFIAFTHFAVLNVVTGVFCQSAMESAQRDQDMVLQLETTHNKAAHVSRIKELFESISSDDSGFLTLTEFERHLKSESVQAYFTSIEVEVDDAWTIFKLLGTQGGAFDIEDFVMGCLRLKGVARSVDIALLLNDQKWLAKKVVDLTTCVEVHMMTLHDSFKRLPSVAMANPQAKSKAERVPPLYIQGRAVQRPSVSMRVQSKGRACTVPDKACIPAVMPPSEQRAVWTSMLGGLCSGANIGNDDVVLQDPQKILESTIPNRESV